MDFKKFLKGILVFSLGLFLAACGNSEGSSNGDSASEAADGQTELIFWHAMGGSAGDALESIVDDYNASQENVVVNAQYQGSYDETLTKLRSSASGSDVNADLVQVFEQGTTFMIDSGLTVPVQEYVDTDSFDLSAFEENLLAFYTVDETLHSMPFNSSTPLLYYNADVFDAAGLSEPPATLEELYEIAPDLMEQENVEMAISTTIYGWFLEQWLNKGEFDIYNNGDGREGTPTEVAFIENGGMEKALSAWKEGVDNGAMPNVGREGGQPEFVSGQSAMTLASTANLNQILTEVGDRFEVGTAYFPAMDSEDEGDVSIGGASLWMIDTGDQAKMDATWDFMQYLVSPTVQAQWNVDTGYFPVTQEAHNEQVFQDNLEEYPQFQTAIDQLHDARPVDQAGISGVNQEARMTMEAELENVLNENSTIEEGAAAMAEQINRALETYNRTNSAAEEE